jgi:hypothetical protein
VVEGDGARIRVEEMDRLRVARVKLTRLDTAARRPASDAPSEPETGA